MESLTKQKANHNAYFRVVHDTDLKLQGGHKIPDWISQWYLLISGI